MARFLMRAHSSNPDYSGDCDYAVIDVTPDLAARMAARHDALVAAKAADPDLYETTYWHYACKFFRYSDAADEALGREDFVPFPDGLSVPEEDFQRTDCDRMVVAEGGVRWECYVKHADPTPTIDTARLPIDLIRKLAA